MQKKVPFLDLRVRDEESRRDLLGAVEAVCRHGRFVMGPEVEQLERKVAERCGRQYAVGVGSGSDALFLALRALKLGPGDEVITSALSWIATANAISLSGATPVFADIGDDLNIDPESVRSLITPGTRAIMPVHFTGKICDMAALMELARQHGLLVIEDAAQAFGAALHGRQAGSFGDVACFSMNPMKVFAACGEAGMIVTDRQEIHERLITLRYNGTVDREKCTEISLNGRIDTLQAAILLRRLEKLAVLIEKRRQIAAWYDEQLADLVDIPCEAPGQYDVYYTYTIRASRRDELKRYLEDQGIETKIQHAYLMPQQPAYQKNNNNGHFPNARRLQKRILCIPAHEKLSRADVDYVGAAIRRFYEKGG